jgi:hypothetical protein
MNERIDFSGDLEIIGAQLEKESLMIIQENKIQESDEESDEEKN